MAVDIVNGIFGFLLDVHQKRHSVFFSIGIGVSDSTERQLLFFSVAQQPYSDLGLLFVKVSRSHAVKHHIR
jgi:hypothetical protein